MIRKAIIAGVSVFIILLLINMGLGELFRSRIIGQNKETVSIIGVFTHLNGIKVAISEFYNANGKLPENNNELGIGAPESLSERWVKSVTVGPSGRIDAALNDIGDNSHIYLYAIEKPNRLGTTLGWRCYVKGVQQASLDTIHSPSCVLLKGNASPPNLKSKEDKPTVEALIKAIRNRKNGLVRVMIQKKVDVNGRDASGESPLRVAIEHSDNYCVQQLVSAGAEVNEAISNKNNKTLLMIAAENRVHGGLKIRELLRAGADIKARDNTEKTALIHAAINNDSEAARVLLEHGADVKSFDYKGQTAKDYAALLHGKSSRVYRGLMVKRRQEDSFIYRLPGD